MGELLVAFDVIGIPTSQGSKRAFNAKNTGKAMMKESGGVGMAAWRNAVSEAALRAKNEGAIDGPLDGPMRLVAEFRFPMPASRKKAERAQGWLWKSSAPDTSKLIRLVEDSMQAAGLIKDDARFAEHEAHKLELLDSWSGVRIRIERCTNTYPEWRT